MIKAVRQLFDPSHGTKRRGLGYGFRPLALAVFLCLALLASPALAGGIVLELPVDCDMLNQCSIQKYVDRDPGPGRRDYACGSLSSDGHTGTDFRVPDVRAMRAGVAVVAAAPGVVKAVRDGMDDVNVRTIGGPDAVKYRSGGNMVVISHEGAWETRYLHLQKGSVAVRQGQKVRVGQKLGLIGMSGLAEYPHTHFTLVHLGRVVDPFTGENDDVTCGDVSGALWSPKAMRVLGYRSGGLLAVGFDTKKPSALEARAGNLHPRDLPRNSPALVFWGDSWGIKAGDKILMRLVGPSGRVLAGHAFDMPRDKAQYFAFVGKPRPQGGWPPGDYRGEYAVMRVVNGVEKMIIGTVKSLRIR